MELGEKLHYIIINSSLIISRALIGRGWSTLLNFFCFEEKTISWSLRWNLNKKKKTKIPDSHPGFQASCDHVISQSACFISHFPLNRTITHRLHCCRILTLVSSKAAETHGSRWSTKSRREGILEIVKISFFTKTAVVFQHRQSDHPVSSFV